MKYSMVTAFALAAIVLISCGSAERGAPTPSPSVGSTSNVLDPEEGELVEGPVGTGWGAPPWVQAWMDSL